QRLVHEEERLRNRAEELQLHRMQLDRQMADLNQQIAAVQQELARVARLDPREARELVLQRAREETLRDAAELSRHILQDAELRAEEKARRILATVVQRYAGEYTFESTTASIAISGDDIKGRIIGRE